MIHDIETMNLLRDDIPRFVVDRFIGNEQRLAETDEIHQDIVDKISDARA